MSFFSLNKHDYVIHEKYGVGKFIAIENITIDGAGNDFIKVEYAENSSIFVPIFDMRLIKYYASRKSNISIDSLNKKNSKHKKLKEKFEEAAREMVQLAAKRQITEIDPIIIPDFAEFDRISPYQITESQRIALKEVFADLEKTCLMDRIICADVGYGKTEIAIRASYAVLCSERKDKKVLIVAPTRLLAMELYKTFKTRLDFCNKKIALHTGINSDFNKDDWEAEKIDLLITTSQNISLIKNLGLIVLDEEHHFGAKFKEHLRSHTNFLQLSATPIPRTLNFALSGIKDISSIEFPPFKKNEWKMKVIYEEDWSFDKIDFNEIKKVIIVVPRISFIQLVEEAIPEGVSYTIMHGKLGNDAIKQNMELFSSGKVQCLISTNIIESGINMPEANFIVIFKIHLFGVAQLHQLRGRIGREKDSKPTVYLIASTMTEACEARIASLLEYNFGGMSYDLAIRDMKMRGSGTAFGEKQSGNFRGLDMVFYYQMLSNEIYKIKHGDDAENITFENFNAYIPQDIIEDERLRLNYYEKLFCARDKEILKAMQNELACFSDDPNIANLLEIIRVKMILQGVKVKTVKKIQDQYLITMDTGAGAENTEKRSIRSGARNSARSGLSNYDGGACGNTISIKIENLEEVIEGIKLQNSLPL